MTEKKITFSRYHATRYLAGEQDQQTYLEVALEEGAQFMIALAVANATQACISQFARDTRMTRDGMYKAFSG